MKYKKLLILITCLLFVTVAVFCFVSAFRVTGIELSAVTISASNENVSEKCQTELKKYEGKNLIFVSTNDIESNLKKLSGYIEVESVEKDYPNRLIVKIKEKKESFVIKNGNDYFALDTNFCVLSKKDNLKNNVDGKDNILLEVSVADYSTNLIVGETLRFFDSKTQSYLNEVSSLLYSNRSNISKVTISVKKDGAEYKTLTLTMKEGVCFKILKANEQTELKINKTLEFYQNLSNKGAGEYVTVLENNGNITVKQ